MCLKNLPLKFVNESTKCFKKNFDFTALNYSSSSSSNLYNMLNIQLFTMQNTHNSTTLPSNLNILDIAKVQASLVHPGMTIVSLISQCMAMIILLLTMIPRFIWECPLNRSVKPLFVALGVLSVSCCINGFNATLIQSNMNATYKIVPLSSMNVVQIEKGKKLSSMIWTSFIMHFLQLFLLSVSIKRYMNGNNDKTPNRIDNEESKRNYYNPDFLHSSETPYTIDRNKRQQHQNDNKNKINHQFYSFNSNDSHSTYI